MNWRILLAIVASCFALAFTATPAAAQATRTWVSGVGDDANPCSRTAPCKTFAGAISKTAAGGEIDCLDPGGFGGVTITKSITIDCDGTLGGVLGTAGGTSILVNGSNIVVVLRNLSLNGGTPASAGLNGVRILSAAQVNIENVRIQGYRATNGRGVLINPTSGTVIVNITNCIISHNGTASTGAGITAQPTGTGAVALFLNNVEVNNNFQGVNFATNGTSSSASALGMQHSVAFRNPGGGVSLTSGASTFSVMLDDITVDGQGNGIIMNGTGVTVRLGGSTFSFNGTAVANTNGTILSFKNNQIDLNGNNSTPITQVLLQ